MKSTSDIIEYLRQTSSDVTHIDLDVSPAISSDDQLRAAVILMNLGFNVTIRPGESFTTIIKGERP